MAPHHCLPHSQLHRPEKIRHRFITLVYEREFDAYKIILICCFKGLTILGYMSLTVL